MNDSAASAPDLGILVDTWLDWKETGVALGVSVNQIRTMIREHDLAAAETGGGLTSQGVFAPPTGRPGGLEG